MVFGSFVMLFIELQEALDYILRYKGIESKVIVRDRNKYVILGQPLQYEIRALLRRWDPANIQNAATTLKDEGFEVGRLESIKNYAILWPILIICI